MSESQNQTERLLPVHLGGRIPEVEEARQRGASAQELFNLRERELSKVEDLPPDIRLKSVEAFQRLVKEAQDLRMVYQETKDSKALMLYIGKKDKIDLFLQEGNLAFEKAYREYIRCRRDYSEFMDTFHEVNRLEDALQSPSFKDLPDDKRFDPKAYARLEAVMGSETIPEASDEQVVIEALKTIYPEDSEEYKQALKSLKQKDKREVPLTKKQIEKRITQLKGKAQEMWGDPMVRYFTEKYQVEKNLQDFSQGKDVIEFPTVIEILNQLHDWEKLHPRTTIGGVLVGPPGVGKTTMVRHYLEEKGRKYGYIDLSEEVTRYLLYGSKAIEFKSPTEYYERLADDLSRLDEEGFRRFVQENNQVIQQSLGLLQDEATVTLLTQLKEELTEAETSAAEELKVKLAKTREMILNQAKQAYRRELASEFAHLVKKNGWRDGVVIALLRRGQSIIFDEFPKFKNWSLIFGLMTAQPGKEWYFADNDEWIKIPEDWRMFFTGNIGRKHGGFVIAEALASRAGGKVIEVDFPPFQEEMLTALAACSNPEGDFLRSKEDLAKLYVLIHEAFQKIRDFIRDKPQSISVSYRTIRDIGEKLVLQIDPKTRKPVYQPTNSTFDEAVYAVMVEPYSLYEDKTIPTEIVNLLTTTGILLDPKVEKKVLKWVSKETLEERRKTFSEHKQDFDQIVEEIRKSRYSGMTAIPTQRTF